MFLSMKAIPVGPEAAEQPQIFKLSAPRLTVTVFLYVTFSALLGRFTTIPSFFLLVDFGSNHG